MSELAEFLLARIAEDEEKAREAADDQGVTWVELYGNVIPDPRLDNSYVAVGPWESEVGPAADHIARWDPARVLAECEAKRRIVELHAITVTEDWVNPIDGPAYRDDDHTCAICGWVRDACDTVKLLALPYADHPAYRPEWRP